MPDIDIGDFELDENSNGELVIKDNNDTEVFTVDPTSETTKTKSLDTGEIKSRNGYTDVSASRSFGTFFSNTIGEDLYVSVIGVAGGTGQFLLEGQVEASQTGNIIISNGVQSGASEFDRYSVSFVVPDQYYYRVRDLSDASSSIGAWQEDPDNS